MTLTFESKLDQDFQWALQQGGRHLRGEGDVHETLMRIAQRLDALGIDYALVGGLALFYHGHRRFTEDVDLLVTRDDLQTIYSELECLGYLPPFKGARHLRDTSSGVKVEFFVAGEYPGDGKPKPVAFPVPRDCVTEVAGLRVLDLPHLVELKLASGLSAEHRQRDLIDVQDLIVAIGLDQAFAERLDPSVRDAYLERWRLAQSQREDPNAISD